MGSETKLDLSQIDLWIRQGRGAEAREVLRAARPQALGIRSLCRYAALCRRVSLYQEGLSSLRRVFFEEREKPQPDGEVMAEYAALLTEIGATAISGKIFARLQPLKGNALLYAALRHMKIWDYAAALECLKDFESEDPYWRDIAAINRLACVILLKDFHAAANISGQLKARKKSLNTFVRGSLLELEGQLLYFRGEVKVALEHFTNAFEFLKNSSNPVALFAEKWIYICRMHDSADKTIESDLKAFQKRAREIGQWEVIRDLDRHLALRLNDTALMNKVYFGSPHLNYRHLIMRDSKFAPEQTYLHPFGPPNEDVAGTLRLAQMEFISGDKRFNRFPALAKCLLSSLLRDLYRPTAIGTLFEYLFPDEFFDPEFSPAKTHKAIQRFREMCEKQSIPVRVESTPLGFQLTADQPILIEYSMSADYRTRETPAQNLLHVIESELSGVHFTARELSERLNISLSSVNRRIGKLLADGKLEAHGAGRSRTYVKAKKVA